MELLYMSQHRLIHKMKTPAFQETEINNYYKYVWTNNRSLNTLADPQISPFFS